MFGTGPFTISPVNLPARLVGGPSIGQPYFAPVSIPATAAADGSSSRDHEVASEPLDRPTASYVLPCTFDFSTDNSSRACTCRIPDTRKPVRTIDPANDPFP
ncbi:hypothetical protein CH302_01365 [Rhodococcus sp. 15-2388-1-1a]|nr:hypothetical protein CH302_01365 [Rhodococcus sp. 15-2388-1-1a]